MASTHPNVQVVDAFQFSEAAFTDPAAFGFNPNLNFDWVQQLAAGTHQFAPNELAFFDGEHPTYAGHSALAAFADANLTSDTDAVSRRHPKRHPRRAWRQFHFRDTDRSRPIPR